MIAKSGNDEGCGYQEDPGVSLMNHFVTGLLP